MNSTRRAVILCGMAVCLSLMSASLVRSEVFAVPTSDDVVVGSLVLKGGIQAKFRAREGTMVTVRESDGFFGFVPQIQDKINKKVKIFPFKITDLPPSPEAEDRQHVDEILGESKVLGAGMPGLFTSGSLAVTLQLKDISTGRFLNPVVPDPDSMTPQDLKVLFGTASGDVCCVSCGGITVCANGGVSMGCGSCFGGGGGGKMPV